MTLEEAQDILSGDIDYTKEQYGRARLVEYRAFEALSNIKSMIKYPVDAEELICLIEKEIKFVESWGDE